jgi:drug/metabolite transporter (DMT)-like permease
MKIIISIILGIMGAVILAFAGESRDSTITVDIFNWSSPAIELKTVSQAVGATLVFAAGIVALYSRRKDRINS